MRNRVQRVKNNHKIKLALTGGKQQLENHSKQEIITYKTVYNHQPIRGSHLLHRGAGLLGRQ
jgi:hypothetical protein